MNHFKPAAALFSFLFALAFQAGAQAQTVLYSFHGDAINDNLGNAVRRAGDVNGDGYADVIVGSPREGTFGFLAGRSQVFSGIDGSVLHTFYGSSGFNLFGSSVAGAGDVNRDGYDDVIIGAPYANSVGTAYVYSGKDGALLHQFMGVNVDDNFGRSVDGAGDVNRDGYPDLIVGSPWEKSTAFFQGGARVYSGLDGSELYEFLGPTNNVYLGIAVAGLGDVNGDGFADVLVGAERINESAGAIRVYSGFDGSILHEKFGQSAGDYFGQNVGRAGDVNGDGFDDMIIGSWGDDNNGEDSGSAKVLSGIDFALLHDFDGDGAGDMFGIGVSGAGDLNCDGYADLIVGASNDDDGGEDAGSVRIISGLDGSVLTTIDGAAAGDDFGIRVSSCGDTNGDGVHDLIVGAPRSDVVADNAGSATIISYDGPKGPWRDLGKGLDGTYEAPVLRGLGSMVGGENWKLYLSGAPPLAPAFMFYGFSQLNLPYQGGVIVPDFTGAGGFFKIPINIFGTWSFSNDWPAGLPGGVPFYFQTWIVDFGAPLDACASNAISGTTPL